MTEMTELLARVEKVEQAAQEFRDIEAIRALKGKYAEACDLGYNADAMVELFTEDAVWEFTNAWGVHRGHAEIHKFMVDVAQQIKWALHFMIGPTITITSPTTAVGKWYILELATMTGLKVPEDLDPVILSGVYNDEYVKVDGEWKFKHVKVNIGQDSSLLEGWVAQPTRG